MLTWMRARRLRRLRRDLEALGYEPLSGAGVSRALRKMERETGRRLLISGD